MNNAGMFHTSDFANVTMEEVDKSMQVKSFLDICKMQNMPCMCKFVQPCPNFSGVNIFLDQVLYYTELPLNGGRPIEYDIEKTVRILDIIDFIDIIDMIDIIDIIDIIAITE